MQFRPILVSTCFSLIGSKHPEIHELCICAIVSNNIPLFHFIHVFFHFSLLFIIFNNLFVNFLHVCWFDIKSHPIFKHHFMSPSLRVLIASNRPNHLIKFLFVFETNNSYNILNYKFNFIICTFHLM